MQLLNSKLENIIIGLLTQPLIIMHAEIHRLLNSIKSIYIYHNYTLGMQYLTIDTTMI